MSNQTLSRGLQLIELLSDYPNGCPLLKIAERSGLNKSTVHRLLQTLQEMGFVKNANTQGAYRLTTKCLMLGQKTLNSMNILSIVAPILEELNVETGETVNFSVLDQDYATMIYKLEPTCGMMKTRSYIGQRFALYCSAMGKNFLAYMRPEQVESYWQRNKEYCLRLTKHTITEFDKMQEELDEIRKNGYALDNEENEIGVTCIAFPIFDNQNKVKYAISIALSTARLQQIDGDKLFASLKKAADKISIELGASITEY